MCCARDSLDTSDLDSADRLNGLAGIEMYVVLFRIRTRGDIDESEYGATFAKMLEYVSQLSGFIGIEGFAAEDGAELAVALFDSLETITEWRDHPEHVKTRERGRTEFFSEYDITIAHVERQYSWQLG